LALLKRIKYCEKEVLFKKGEIMTDEIFKMMCQLANIEHVAAETPTGKILYYFADTSISATDYTEARALQECIVHLAHKLNLDEHLVQKEVQHLLNNDVLSIRNKRGDRDGAGYRKDSYELWVSPRIEEHIRTELDI